MNHTVTEESGEPLAHRPYVNERAMLADLFTQNHLWAAGTLIVSRQIQEPTTAQTLEALRYVARIYQQEAERFLNENP